MKIQIKSEKVCLTLKNNDRVIQVCFSDFHLKDTVLLFNN
jgi:hypothetical protein